MSELIISARAPSNIALIKYMGKKDSSKNIPENPSISMTLNSLCTVVEIAASAKEGGPSIQWVPEPPRLKPQDVDSYPWIVPQLGDHGVGKIIRHLERVKTSLPAIFQREGLEVGSLHQEGRFELRTVNTFPAASGIASSASSFAAITLGLAAACSKDVNQFRKALDQGPSLRRDLAKISRQGSGSSCRSFEGPWVHWDEEDAKAVAAGKTPDIAHFVVLIKTDPKRVSSSDAHAFVRTSPLWEKRVQRVHQRTQQMLNALQSGSLAQLSQIAWSEAWEMHSLFHTCERPFSYWEPGTMKGLQWFADQMSDPVPPIVTLDAGPNIHVMVEKSQRALWRDRLKEQFHGSVILEDEQGSGAQIFGTSLGAEGG